VSLAGTQEMSCGELSYVVQNRIRLSAMAAWSGGNDQDAADSWKLVHFIRHLPQQAAEKKEMEKLNPKSPDDLKEEEERFLKGEDINDHPIKHHERQAA